MRRFDDVPGVEKSCVAKGVNKKKAKKKYVFIAINMFIAIKIPPNI